MRDFVYFGLAKKLRDKGLREYSDLSYNETGSVNDTEIYRESGEFYCYAPTIARVLKWLREEKDIVVTMRPHYGDGTGLYWRWEVSNPVYRIEVPGNVKQCDFESYESAATAGIEYAVDALIRDLY